MTLPTKLPKELTDLIGVWTPKTTSQVVVERTFIDHWVEVFQDGNPAYSDEDWAAKSRYGTRIAPWTCLNSLMFPYEWRAPSVVAKDKGLPPKLTSVSPSAILREKLGLQGTVALYMGLDWYKPTKQGDRVSFRRKVVRIEGPRSTGVGDGYVVEYDGEFSNQKDEVVCTIKNIIFVYEAGPRPEEQFVEGHLPGLYHDLSGHKLPQGLPGEKPLGTLTFPNPWLMHYRAASAMRDWNIFHINSEYVRAHGGVKSMYVSMLLEQALISRFATDWSGPEWEMRKLHATIGALIHPGDTIRLNGAVTRRYKEGKEERVDMAMLMSTQRCNVMTIDVTVGKPA